MSGGVMVGKGAGGLHAAEELMYFICVAPERVYFNLCNSRTVFKPLYHMHRK